MTSAMVSPNLEEEMTLLQAPKLHRQQFHI